MGIKIPAIRRQLLIDLACQSILRQKAHDGTVSAVAANHLAATGTGTVIQPQPQQEMVQILLAYALEIPHGTFLMPVPIITGTVQHAAIT